MSQQRPIAVTRVMERIEYIELYVSNNRCAAHFCRSALGFRVVGMAGFDVPEPDTCSIVMQNGPLRLLLTSPRLAESPAGEHIRKQGKGVKDILDLLAVQDETPSADCALTGIDRVAIALKAGELYKWVDFYRSAFDVIETHQEQVRTDYSSMRSKVVQSDSGSIRFPMMEPAPGKRKSQIEEYIHCHDRSGVQHLAFASRDIVKSLSAMASLGIEFLAIPPTYYETLNGPIGGSAQKEMDGLRRHGIVADRDEVGIVLQTFTKPVGPRATLFFEVIERKGAVGFGGGNIKALFEAVERPQAARGTLSCPR
jgi:4-hydroxyphenylpyruvate dioxygenase-like putative hemolysin